MAVIFQSAPTMELRALFLFFLSVWSHDASGRTHEGVLAQENAWQKANEAKTLSSEVGNGVSSPWEPSSRSPERVKRSLGAQDRNHGKQGTQIRWYVAYERLVLRQFQDSSDDCHDHDNNDTNGVNNENKDIDIKNNRTDINNATMLLLIKQ